MLLRVCECALAVEGELRAVAVDGLEAPVMVTRVDGAVVVTTSICPHEVVSLVSGALEAGVVTCPGHGYEFDLATGACGHDPSLRLRTFRVVDRDDGWIWIDLIRDAG